jgi:hypothetical protein
MIFGRWRELNNPVIDSGPGGDPPRSEVKSPCRDGDTGLEGTCTPSSEARYLRDSPTPTASPHHKLRLPCIAFRWATGYVVAAPSFFCFLWFNRPIRPSSAAAQQSASFTRTSAPASCLAHHRGLSGMLRYSAPWWQPSSPPPSLLSLHAPCPCLIDAQILTSVATFAEEGE